MCILGSALGCGRTHTDGVGPASQRQEVHASASPFGAPLPGLSPSDLALFSAGQQAFAEIEGIQDGLGPVFNGTSCGGCHSVPAVGGGSPQAETRFGQFANGTFDPLTSSGGSLLQAEGIGAVVVNGLACTVLGETLPPAANVVAGRLTTPLFGLGLVDAVPDSAFQLLAASQAANTPATAGRVSDLGGAIGKFGWKAQVPSLLQFAGDAYLNEMGITSPDFPHENCPDGNCELAATCDPVPDPEDDGTDVHAFANFMTFLNPPPRGPMTGVVNVGQTRFTQLGCADCHVASLTTGFNLNPALSNVTFAPYSDFLLHDMGPLGDGIFQGAATGTEMRTAPLWGLRVRTVFLHDGRASSVSDAILAHDGQGKAARDAFANLPPGFQMQLLDFLGSL
jgi:CxxC motif-containing protein (DUF1111 family)